MRWLARAGRPKNGLVIQVASRTRTGPRLPPRASAIPFSVFSFSLNFVTALPSRKYTHTRANPPAPKAPNTTPPSKYDVNTPAGVKPDSNTGRPKTNTTVAAPNPVNTPGCGAAKASRGTAERTSSRKGGSADVLDTQVLDGSRSRKRMRFLETVHRGQYCCDDKGERLGLGGLTAEQGMAKAWESYARENVRCTIRFQSLVS
jgi:hypothetical protein